MSSVERHFQRRPARGTPDYEDGYWHVVIDPDGKRRNRLDERAQHVADLREELEFVNALEPTELLDVGCGAGFFLSGVDAKHRRFGVEISRFAAENARQFAEIHAGTLESAGFASGRFGAVVLHHVIEHVEDPGALIGEIRRVLAPDGHLVLGTPDFDSGAARRFGERFRLLHDPTHVSLFSAESMHRFLREHGFAIERVSFPFFETRHFTRDNLERLFDTSQISPAFYGSFMTFYARRPAHPRLVAALASLGVVSGAELARGEREGAAIVRRLRGARSAALGVSGPPALVHAAVEALRARGLRAEPLPARDDDRVRFGDVALSLPASFGVPARFAQLLVLEACLAEAQSP